MEMNKILNAIRSSREVISRQVEQRSTADPMVESSEPANADDNILDRWLRRDLTRAADTLASLGSIEATVRADLGRGQQDDGGGEDGSPMGP